MSLLRDKPLLKWREPRVGWKVELEGQKLEILEIQYWDGNKCILEIDPSMPGDTVIDTLRQRGLQVRRASGMVF